jgi:hypothetical protein
VSQPYGPSRSVTIPVTTDISLCFFIWYSEGGVGVQLCPLGTAATNRPTVPAPGEYDGEIGGMIIGRGKQSTRRKPSEVSLCPPQTQHAGRAAAVGSQRLTA